MGKARNIADLLNSSGKIDSADIDSSAQFYQFKNRIINGAMMIDQRNAGASVTQNTVGVYPVDRWLAAGTVTSKFTAQQNAGSVTPPDGFRNYLGCTSSSAYSVLTGDAFWIHQRIEGFNVADLGWGTANAKTITISFWVRSSLTGTFGGSVFNGNPSSAGWRSYPFTYTITSSNTWEQKSITIAGDTSGTWLTTNGSGLQLNFSLGTGTTFSGTAGAWAGSAFYSATGATSVVGTNGATFYITGVQLEKGSTATSFDYRPYGTELALCQRYFQKSYLQDAPVGSATTNNLLTWYPDATTNYASVTSTLIVSMRSTPSFTLYSSTGTAGAIRNLDSGTNLNALVNAARSDSFHFTVNNTSVGQAATLGVHYTASAEL